MLQHMTLCGTLYEHMVTPIASTAVRAVYVEAMCEQATRDLLCWSLEKGLAQGDASIGAPHACAHRVLAAAAVRTEQAERARM